MPKRKKIDNKKLIQMVQEGKVQKEILEKFGFSNATQLKVAYANALMEVGSVPKIKTGRAAKAAAPKKEITVNKRGSLIVTAPMIQEMGFKEKDAFLVRKTKAGISLKKV